VAPHGLVFGTEKKGNPSPTVVDAVAAASFPAVFVKMNRLQCFILLSALPLQNDVTSKHLIQASTLQSHLDRIL
jgi:hypothetical protein